MKIEDIRDEKVRQEFEQVASLQNLIMIPRLITMIGSVITPMWLSYTIFTHYSWLMLILSLGALGILFNLGISVTFAVAASLLCFKFGLVGNWLPIISYVLAPSVLYLEAREGRLKRMLPDNTPNDTPNDTPSQP